MPFVKGKAKTGGKQKGTPNYKTQQWDALGDAIISVHTERFNRILNEIKDDEAFMDRYTQVLEYFKPKLQRSEVKNTGESTTKITLKL